MYSLDNKLVLVTGGTGSIGKQVVYELLSKGANVIVFSRDQNKQAMMDLEVSSKRVEYVNGDVTDEDLLERLFDSHDINVVVHCAALKHVPICENTPDYSIKVNVEGTRKLLLAIQKHGEYIERTLFISTDKAVYPTSVMGATKMLAEKMCLEFSSLKPISVVRLGNVFGSAGSVVQILKDRIKNVLPLGLNDPDAVRYFITQKDCARFIVKCLDIMQGGEVFIPKMKLMKINDLVEAIKPFPDYPVIVRRLGSGEKQGEELITEPEQSHVQDRENYYVIYPKGESSSSFHIGGSFFTIPEIKHMLSEVHD